MFSDTVFPAASHRILGSVKLPLFWNERGWEKWSSTLSIGIPFFFFCTASCKHGLDSKKAVNISSSYSFTFTFLNCSGLKVSWLWELFHVLFPPQSLFLHPKYSSLLKLSKQGNVNSQFWKVEEGTLHCLKYLISWVSSLKQGLGEFCLLCISKQVNHGFTVQTTWLVWGWACGLQHSRGPLVTTSGLRALKTLPKHKNFNVKLTGGVYSFQFLYCKLTFGGHD